jgi:hypothetical protein
MTCARPTPTLAVSGLIVIDAIVGTAGALAPPPASSLPPHAASRSDSTTPARAPVARPVARLVCRLVMARPRL